MRKTRPLLRVALAVLATAMLALAGCVSVPQATPERDAEAKRFLARPDAATIYIYRPDFLTAEMDDSVVYVGDRLLGMNLPGTFFRFDVLPGAHVVRSVASSASQIRIDARAGELYFVRLYVSGGNSLLGLVDADAGKRDILRCCALMENWAPGQRYLLR